MKLTCNQLHGFKNWQLKYKNYKVLDLKDFRFWIWGLEIFPVEDKE
jgi:hypothetical protein